MDNVIEIKQKMTWMNAQDFPLGADRSELIWIRVAEVSRHGVVTTPAYTVLGRCVRPKVPVAYHPVQQKNPEITVSNPATRVEWGEGAPFYESYKGVRVEATHWYPCVEPLPPGAELPLTTTDAINYVYSEVKFQL